jgi:hypothetical protein
MPYLGLNVPVGSGSSQYSTGLRLGGLFGFNLGPSLSLNGEMTIDIMNPDWGGSSGDVTEAYVDFAFSPLFHFGTPQLEFVVGPKLGFFGEAANVSYASGPDDKYSGSGLVYGLNAGVFVPVGNMAIGGLFSFTGHSYSKMCTNDSTTGYVDLCGDASGTVAGSKVIAFTGALLY